MATQKVDPSVRPEDTEQRGEPRGSVPIERTMRKPDAYYPPKQGPK